LKRLLAEAELEKDALREVLDFRSYAAAAAQASS
jgi:hypothetical protein